MPAFAVGKDESVCGVELKALWRTSRLHASRKFLMSHGQGKLRQP